MKNSTLNNLPAPIPSNINDLFCILDEYGALGNNPKTHPKWKIFIQALKRRYCYSIAGIIISSYVENGHTSFCFMLYPIGPTKKGGGLFFESKSETLREIFKIHKGRTLEEFVSI